MDGVGWIKLHRKIMNSDTFECLNAIQKLIAIYIILNANHEDGVWHDKYKNVSVPVKRGQLITSRNKIVTEWFGNDKEVTEQKVRTALKKLEKIRFLTIESTKAYSLITVCNYWLYQQKENEANQGFNHELTKDQPSPNHELTTNKNDKNVKNEKKDIQQQPGAPVDYWLHAYEMGYGHYPTLTVTQLMNSYLDDGVEQKALSYALQKAAENGQQFHYAKGIINKWIAKGIFTYEAALAEEDDFNKRKVERIHAAEKRKRPETNRPNVKGADISKYDFSSSRNSL